MITEKSIQEVRDRADLVEIIGETVQLKRSGREFKGKCPFHDDRSPSFYVVPDKGFYKCFGCGESGDVFGYVMKRTGMDFADAVRQIAGRYGIHIEETRAPGEGEEDPLRPLYEANAFARDWFRARLLDPEEGTRPRAYLEARGIDMETAEAFGLGYAPPGWGGLREHARAHELSDDLLLEVGLLTTSERSPEPYDRFRDRLVFPIESISGKVVGFGGRVLEGAGKGVPKYLNSPESPVYHKGEMLYALGWNRNRIRREEVALVVEGYMDVVALAAGGVSHAVATLGTAMTTEQARLLRRYTGRALLLFDSDEAGLRATFRAGDALLAAGVHPSVVSFPSGEDPDTVIRAEGEEGLKKYLSRAVDVFDRKIQLLEEHGYFDSLDRTRRAVDKLLPTVRATSDPSLRDMYLARLSERTGIRRETLEEEVARSRSTATSPPGGRRDDVTRGRASGPGAGAGSGRSSRSRVPHGLGPERQLMMVLLRAREFVERAAEQVGPADFLDPVYRDIYAHLLNDPGLSADTEGLSAEVLRRIEELQGDPEELQHTAQVYEASIAALRDRALEVNRIELEGRLREAASEEEKRRILQELGELRRERPGRWNVIRRGRAPEPSIQPERTE
jgi:DNA primase